ncbi:MAG TPA: TetR/AcrR family transcriptional regulator [Deferrisomatales bacterium]|nr:TetR/AcrR family transcriptional regulator [Deferrisomatales bacterium]
MGEILDFKSLDKSVRKQAVIDTAVEVFHRKGYRAATLDDVAAELGVTRAALYHYVSSKENLLSTIYLQALESFFATVYEIGESDLSPPEKLRAFVRHNIKHVIIENLSMFGVFFSEEAQLPEEAAGRIREEKRKYTDVVEKILREGMEGGYFRRDDPRLRTYAILGMCNWTYKWYRPGKTPQSPDEIADQFIAMMEEGLCAPGEQDAQGGGGAPARGTRAAGRKLREQAEALVRLADELETGRE